MCTRTSLQARCCEQTDRYLLRQQCSDGQVRCRGSPMLQDERTLPAKRERPRGGRQSRSYTP